MLVELKSPMAGFRTGEKIDVGQTLGAQLVRDGKAQLVEDPRPLSSPKASAPTVADVKAYAATHGIKSLRDAAKQMSADTAAARVQVPTTPARAGDNS